MAKEDNSGLGTAIAALVLGIMSILYSLFVIGAILGLVGAIIAIVHLAKQLPRKGLTTAGLALSIIGILVSCGFLALYSVGVYRGFKMPFGARYYQFDKYNIGKAAPQTSMKTIDGEEIKLSDLKGKRVLLDFWATWCPPCKKEIPHLIELRKTTNANELVIIGISDEPPDVIRRFRQQMQINYPLVSEPNSEGLLPPFNKVNSIPTFFIIDANGTIENANTGYVSYEQLKKYALGTRN